MTALDCIHLEGMSVSCIIGVYPEERCESQPLIVDMSCFLDTRPAARGGGLSQSIDYARLCGEIRFLLESCRFELLEQAAEGLCAYVLALPTADNPRAQVEEVRVKLTKPTVLAPMAVPSVEVHRYRADMLYGMERRPFGEVDVIYENDGCGIYRSRIAPESKIAMHYHAVMDEHELVLGTHILVQNERALAGSARYWPKLFPHAYENVSTIEQTILCVERPRFIADDEVPVGGLSRALQSIPSEQYYVCSQR